MDTLTGFVLRHRRLVGLFWLIVVVAGAAAAGRVGERLTFDFSLPGQPGYQAEQQLVSDYGVSSFDTLIPVVTVPAGSTVADRQADVDGVFAAVRTALPEVRVVDRASSGDARFTSPDGRTAFALVQGPLPAGFGPGIETTVLPTVQAAAQQVGFDAGLTSYNLLSAGGDTQGPSVLAETLIGALGALAVLLFVFASFMALVPLLIAAVSILTTSCWCSG